MTINQQRLETGVKRLYYVVWACFSLIYVYTVGQHMWHEPPPSTMTEMVDLGSRLAGAILGPGVLMLMVRWVYRGFVPKHI